MTSIKTQVWAAFLVSSLLSSSIGIGAADHGAVTPAPPAAPLRDAISHSVLGLAAESSRPRTSANRRDAAAQDPVSSARVRPACGCRFPSWLKYSLIGAAGAGGGYALSQMGHQDHGRRGQGDNDANAR